MACLPILLLASFFYQGAAVLISAARRPNASASVCGPQAKLSTSQESSRYLWSNKNGDATCTGFATYSAPSKLDAGPSWSWKDETASIVSVHPCIDAEMNIYISNRNGVVRKFTSDGKLLWHNAAAFTDGTHTLTGGCVIKDGSVFVGATSGEVLSINMESGNLRWKVKAGAGAGPDAWSLVAHSGILVVATRSPEYGKPSVDFGGQDLIAALDAETGARLWTFRPGAQVYNFIGSFVDGPPSLVFSDQTGVPYRLALCDGSLLWKNQEAKGDQSSTGGAIVEPSAGRVFVTSNAKSGMRAAGRITAYSLADGKLLWQHRVAMPANNAPVVGRLRPGSSRLSVVVALGDNPSFPDPTAERTGYFSNGSPVAWESKILALDADTGNPTGWEYTPEVYRKPQAYGDAWPDHICLPDSWSNAAIGGDGTVYAGHMSGRIFAFRDIDGDGVLSKEKGEVSSYFGGRCYQGSPGLAPGMLVATPCDGVHVFKA